MKQSSLVFTFASLFSLVYGHGFVTTPQPRMPGSAMEAACGQQVAINQESDNYGNIQGELQVAASQSDYDAAACDIWLCKGYKFADNTDNVYSYTAGQVVDFVVDIRAPHTGVANVSIIDTASNTVISGPLKSWTDYASVATGVTKDETNFSITIPDDLGSQCAEPGACVIQWYWFAESIDQTYESCIDFTLGGTSNSGSTTSSAPTTTTTTAAAATTTSTTTTTTITTAAPTTTTTTAPTTLTTIVKPATTTTISTVTTTSSSAPTSWAIPKDGTAEEQLHWVASMLKSLLDRYL